MQIAVIGAGFAGLSAAKVLTEFGHEVTVYDTAPDVGGVWSATRRYPGLTTQNDKGTYAFSDHPMPADYPEWPSGEQVQAYLESYVERFDLAPMLRLSTRVRTAAPAEGGGWTLDTTRGPARADHLVCANGIFSTPFVPAYDGAEEFRASGGEILAAGELHDVETVAGRRVVVVGYGKSACDVAVEISRVAASTTVVARELLWKMPRRLQGVLNYKYLLLGRLGEALFRYRTVSGVERVLHARESAIASAMLASVGAVTVSQLGLRELGLVPRGTFADIARSTVSLVSEGFFEAVREGSIAVARDAEVTRLEVVDGVRSAVLSDGSRVLADVVVAATGFRQEVPFLGDEVTERLTNDRGDFVLYRQILPTDVPDLTFAGYNSSFFSPLSAELSAVWIGSHLAGGHAVPPGEERRRLVGDRLAWMRERTQGRHARGTNVIPFSLHNIDEMLGDLGVEISAARTVRQWLLPVSPSDYRHVAARVAQRVRRPDADASSPDGSRQEAVAV